MKKENLFILICFFIGLAIILHFNTKKDQPNHAKQSKQQMLAKTPNNKNLIKKIKTLEEENRELRQQLRQIIIEQKENKSFAQDTIQTPMQEASPMPIPRPEQKPAAKPLDKEVVQQGGFGVYQPYIPYIKALIEYAKTHTIPTTNYQDLSDIFKPKQPYGINRMSNMNIIIISNDIYIKLLQNTVAIYSNKDSYHLDFSLDGSATCVGKKPTGYKICSTQLGGKDGPVNKRIPSWRNYTLPQNLFD